ncbi:protein of unknown function [Bacteroides luti]|uniref:DUF4271 domain-containing protein n=1 Tax=Bacteroides luti TaxID=1297750 RepID=A0A1M4YZ17_9BACE|nr:DUF4271 domain-containing protein [Bacteroides luti]SHF10948.1 protein of unknown function [Bacteroides luti]
MIIELNDSIQKPQVVTQTQAPAKVQTQTQTSAKPLNTAVTKPQSKVNTGNTANAQTKLSSQVPNKSQASTATAANNQVQNKSVDGSQTSTNTQPPANSQILFPIIQNDSIKKSLTEKSDTISKAKEDSVASMPLFYKNHFIPGDSIKWTSLGHQPSGFSGIAIPYRLRTDDVITGLLLLCFIITAYVFAFGKKSLIEQAKSLFSRKDQSDPFGRGTASELRHRIMLRIQTCILLGIFIFNYFHDYNPSQFERSSIYILLGTYTAVCVTYYALKWIIYKFLGWIFFDKNITSSWLESYSTIINYLGICTFPLILLMVYSELSASTILIIGFILIIIAKILMFCKWLKLFFSNLYGLLYLIVYFCALEILPCILLVQGLLQTNIILELKL